MYFFGMALNDVQQNTSNSNELDLTISRHLVVGKLIS